MSEPLISVIVPVYNVEEYLKRSVDSIINQTYINLEIILVNDGSTDNSLEICDAYASIDHRIVVINKKNGGLSDARNAALDIAKGEYITYVDSDDYIAKDYIEYLYCLLKENNADISMCACKKVYEGEELDECREKVECFSSKEALESLLYQKKFTACAYCKLYKRNMFEQIRYPKGMHYEDLAIIYKLLDVASRVVIGKKQKYYYYQRFNSIMNAKFNVKKMQRIQVANDLKIYVDEKHPELTSATSVRCFLAAVQVFREVPKKNEYKEYLDKAWKQIRKYRKIALKDKKAKISIRFIALSTYAGKRVLSMLSKCYSGVFVESRKKQSEQKTLYGRV